jgi:UDP-glucose 4-epimerase|tara:strand:+ start:1332 stop:2234 length:903 start_codon:yes stop_codon:yes gene_type:complete
MRILVTGGAGFIGINLIKRLVKEGHNVHSLDNYDSGKKENHIEGATYHDYDIEQITQWKIRNNAGLNEFDLCFHLAALSRIQPSFSNPSETFRVNTKGTEAVLDWAKQNKVKVIYAGSSSKWHDHTISPYATSKYLGEELCKMYKKSFNLDVEICRFYNVFGPHEIIKGDWAAVIGVWRNQVNKNENITIVGDGKQRRDFTHVDDIVDGLYKIGLSNTSLKDAWELGTGVNYSINEVYQMFKNKFHVECIYIPNQHGNYRETLRKNNKALDLLDWKPQDRLLYYINKLEKDEDKLCNNSL